MTTLRGVTISDFNPENLNALMTNAEGEPGVSMIGAPFGQVHQLLIDADADCWREGADFAIVWTRPQAVLPSFGDALGFEEIDRETLLDEVDAFATLLEGAAQRTPTVLVPSWTLLPGERTRGVFGLADPRGSRRLLLEAQRRLARRLDDLPGVVLLDAEPWIARAGAAAFHPKLWYMAKVPFGSGVFKHAVADLRLALQAVAGLARKLIVVDLDDTLWGGIVGEVGWEQLALGGHDPVGEAHVDFQRSLKALQRQGVVLAIVSKNEESVALGAIDDHPEMVLRRDDFAGWRINWRDKAANVAELVAELNLGLQSAVFIDDNPVERARVRDALPEVLVPEWPEDPLHYVEALDALRCFAPPSLTDEDLRRAAMYRSERQRGEARAAVGSLDDWLQTLETRIRVALLSAADLPRAAQLFNKTNQMNLATRRMPEAELAGWAEGEDRRLWTFTVDDRFGSQGLTGVLGVEANGERLKVTDFLLSCRVMGRRVEDVMLAVAARHARERGLAGGDAVYAPTAKNAPCLAWFKASPLRFEEATSSFHWEADDAIDFPPHIELDLDDA